MKSWLALTCAVLLPLRAFAADGVIEINEARVAAGGISACDAPGYPVEICDSGSYRLTSNLHYPSSSAKGIVVSAPEVTLDLNGMTLAGDNTCTIGAFGAVTGCAAPGKGGIEVSATRFSVRNGRVRGAGSYGLYVGSGDAVIENLEVYESYHGGVYAVARARLDNVSAVRNGSSGIVAEDGSAVHLAVVSGNGFAGLYLSLGSTAERVSATRNGYAGIYMSGASVSGFSATSNGANGVNAQYGSLIESGMIHDNGRADPGHCGVWSGDTTGYRGLALSAASGGNPSTVCGGGINLGGNGCQGVACP